MDESWVHRDLAVKYRQSLVVSRRAMRKHRRTARRLARRSGISFNTISGLLTLLLGFGAAGYVTFLAYNQSPLASEARSRIAQILPIRTTLSPESFSSSMSKKQKREMSTQIHFIATKMMPYQVSLEAGHQIARVIVEESFKTGFDPIFIAALIFAESAFSERAVSRVGALGLMQLMPDTARFVSDMNEDSWLGTEALYSPEYNIKLGTRYLLYLMRSYNGDKTNSLRAYNWGPGNLNNFLKHGGRLPSETVHYVQKINRYHEKWSRDFHSERVKYEFGALYHSIY